MKIDSTYFVSNEIFFFYLVILIRSWTFTSNSPNICFILYCIDLEHWPIWFSFTLNVIYCVIKKYQLRMQVMCTVECYTWLRKAIFFIRIRSCGFLHSVTFFTLSTNNSCKDKIHSYKILKNQNKNQIISVSKCIANSRIKKNC